MIIKGFELNKIDKVNAKIFLIYGENEGFKNEVSEELRDYLRRRCIIIFTKDLFKSI